MINATPESARKSLRVSHKNTPGEQLGEPRITRLRKHIMEKVVDNYVSKSPEPNDWPVEQSLEAPPEEIKPKVDECPEPPNPLDIVPGCSTTVLYHTAAQVTDTFVKKSKIVPKGRKLNEKLEAINNKLSECVAAPFSTPPNQGRSQTPSEETQPKVDECPEPPDPLENVPVCSTTVLNHIAAQVTEKFVKKPKIVPKRQKLSEKLEAINNKLSECVAAPFSTPPNQGRSQTVADLVRKDVLPVKWTPVPTNNEVAPLLLPASSTSVLNHIADQVTDKFVKKSLVNRERNLNEKLEALKNKLSGCVAAPFLTPPNQGQSQNGKRELKNETVESEKQNISLEKLSPAPGNATAGSAVRNSLLWVQEQNTQRVLEEHNRLLEYISIPLDPDVEPPRYKKFKKDNDELKEEERRLDEEAAITVARIREAAVKRIIQTRTSGKTPTCVQVAAQDAEIAHYITATSDVSILNKMPEPTTKALPPNALPPKALPPNALPPKALKRRADTSSSEDPIADSITDVVRKNMLPMKPAPVHTNNVVAPGLLPTRPVGLPNRQLPRSLGPLSQSGHTLRYPIPPFRNPQRVPTMYQGPAHARPMLPVKVVMRPSTTAPIPSPSTVAMKVPKEEPVEPTTTFEEPKEVLVTPKSEVNALSGLKIPKNEPIEEEEETTPNPLPNQSTSSDMKRLIPNLHTAPIGSNQRVVTNGTHVPSGTTTEKIFVTRRPDGTIVPTRRILIRRVPPQVQKVVLAPPPGMNPRPQPPINQLFQMRNHFDVHHRNQATNSFHTLPPVGNGNRGLTSANQPNCGMTQKLVKEEPMEDYQQPYNLYDNTVNPYRTIQTGLFPVSVVPRPNYNTSAIQHRMPGEFPPIIMPCYLDQETGKSRSVFEPAGLQRSTSPPRIFLGAEEPIKDLPGGTKKFSWFTQKIVGNFNSSQLVSFGKRPAPNCIEGTIINKNAREASAVLIEEVEPEKDEDEKEKVEEIKMEIDEGDREEIRRMVEIKKARNQEIIRQKQALAQKLIFNEYKVCEYMQSDTFKDLIKPAEDSTAFQKIVQTPVPLEKLPEFSEALSRTSPALFRNLTRIHHMQNNDVSKFVKDFGEVKERKRGAVFGPVQLTHGVSERMKRKERLRNLSSGIIAMLEVVWSGITTKVPEFIQCTSCGDIMRLCMRKCYYRGVLREYPAYRCLRKGCQTFHSIKKQFHLNIQNKISHWYAIPVPPNPSSKKKKKGAYVGPTKFIIKAVEWKNDLESTPSSEPVENFKSETPEKDIEVPKEESTERPEEKPVAGIDPIASPRGKRIRKNKLETLSKDFLCGSSAAEIARLDKEKEVEEEEEEEEDEDEEAGETVGFRFITDNSNFSEELEDHMDEDDEDNDAEDDDEEEDSDDEDSSDKEEDDKSIVPSPTKALREKPSPSPKKVETPPSRPVTTSRYSTRSSTRVTRKNSN